MTHAGLPLRSRTSKRALAIGRQKLLGHSVLLVEADLWLALNLQSSFAEAGARVVTASELERALPLAEQPDLSVAVIDNSLAAEDKDALCRHLSERRVPFVFHSGRRTEDRRVDAEAQPNNGAVDIDVVVDVVADLIWRQHRSPKPAIVASAPGG